MDRRRKRIIIFFVLTLILGAAVIAGSNMFDEDVSSDNTISAAVFDLKVNGKDVPGPVINFTNVLPGQSYVTEIPVRLVGSGRGELEVVFRNIRIEEGNNSDPDFKEATGTVPPLNEQFYVSINGGTRTTLKEGLNKSIGYLSAGETTIVVLRVDAKTSLDNRYQGDTMKFDIAFRCNQK